MGWQTRSACRDRDPELFFPAGEDYRAPGARAQVQAARAVCQSCPVLRECRTWAVDSGQEFGIWGDTTPDERRAIRRARAAGDPDELIDAESTCRACWLLFALPALDGDICADCQERGADSWV